jgi:hypothetical protein
VVVEAVVVVVARVVVVVARVVVVVARVVVVVAGAVVVVGRAVVVVVGRAVVVVVAVDDRALAIAAICVEVREMFLMALTVAILSVILDADAPRTSDDASGPWQPLQYWV